MQALTSVETGAWEMPVIVLIRELAPTPVWPIMTTLKTSWVLERVSGGDVVTMGVGMRRRRRTDAN